MRPFCPPFFPQAPVPDIPIVRKSAMEQRAVDVTKSLWNWGVVKAGSGVSALAADAASLAGGSGSKPTPTA